VLTVSSVLGVAAESLSSTRIMETIKGQLKKQLETIDKDLIDGQETNDSEEVECAKKETTLKMAIQQSKKDIEECTAVEQSESSNAATATEKADELTSAVSKLQTQKEKTKAAFEVRMKKIDKEIKDLGETVQTISRAIKVLGSGTSASFVQVRGEAGEGSSQESYLSDAVDALSAIVNAAWTSEQDVASIKSFMQTEQRGGESGSITSKLEDMKDDAETLLNKLGKRRMNDRNQQALSDQNTRNELENKNKESERYTRDAGDASSKASDAQRECSDETNALGASEKDLRETKRTCKDAKDEWENNKADFLKEKNVLNDVFKLLEGLSSFVQVSSHSKAAEFEVDRRSSAARVLRKMSRKFNRYGLVQVAEAALNDPFGKVRGMIQSMIDKLDQKMAEMETKQAKCQKDKEDAEKGVTESETKLKKLVNKEQKTRADAQKNKKKHELKKAEREDLLEETNKMEEIRNKERESAKVEIAINRADLDILETVLTKLRGQYESGNPLIEFLESYQGDVNQQTAGLGAAEEKAEKDFQALKQAAIVEQTRLDGHINGVEQKQTFLAQVASEVNPEVVSAKESVENAREYQQQIEEECTEKPVSHEKKMQDNEEQKAGLLEALNILSEETTE